jgi:prephenate dehydrogenase
MTGSEIEGLDGADPHLYENALWLLTDPSGPPGEQRDRLRGLLEGIGALVVEIDPTVHDRIVSMTSHLPYLAAVALVNALLDRFPAPKKALELAAGGFLDTTRVAACPPGVFCDILLANREEVLVGLSHLRSSLAKLEADLASGDAEALETTLARARELRRTLPRFRRGFPVSHHELVVRAQDRPGFLGQLASSLGDARINIVDFVLMHVREGEPGTILLAFRTEDDLDCAVRTLEATGFSVYRR